MIETIIWRSRIGTFLPRRWKTSRSVSTGTIILPSQLATAVLLFSLLVVCGDIESNPGPFNRPSDESEHVKIQDASDRVPKDTLANQPIINLKAWEEPTKTKETVGAIPALDLTKAQASYKPDSAAGSPVSDTRLLEFLQMSRDSEQAKKMNHTSDLKAWEEPTKTKETAGATQALHLTPAQVSYKPDSAAGSPVSATRLLEFLQMSRDSEQAKKMNHTSDLKKDNMRRSDEFYSYDVAMGKDIYGPEADNLQKQGADCPKNPGHKGFIPVTQFKLSNLPPKYRHQDFFELLKKQVDLTVKIITKFVSKDRPVGFPGYQDRGSKCTLVGTGTCMEVKRCSKAAESDLFWRGQFCQCQACQQSGQPQTSWWEVRVHTAAHVIFDDEEAANTEVVFFYDDTESQTITIQGTGVRESDPKTDRCFLVCVVHDGEMDELMNKLNGLCQDVDSVGNELQKKYDKEERPKLCLIISHPHGSTKQISFGEWVHYEMSVDRWTVCCYTTPTCPGSSGAMVRFDWALYYWLGFPHSRSGQDRLGRTGGV